MIVVLLAVAVPRDRTSGVKYPTTNQTAGIAYWVNLGFLVRSKYRYWRAPMVTWILHKFFPGLGLFASKTDGFLAFYWLEVHRVTLLLGLLGNVPGGPVIIKKVGRSPS